MPYLLKNFFLTFNSLKIKAVLSLNLKNRIKISIRPTFSTFLSIQRKVFAANNLKVCIITTLIVQNYCKHAILHQDMREFHMQK